jgi:predicted nucleic acid-binding protein
VDCSVVVKWKIPTEDHAAAAEELFGDWEYQAIDVYVPNHFQSEVISAFLRAHRRGRLSADEAREAIHDLLALPFILCEVATIADRAFTIAQSQNQRAYDCLYVALAEREGVEFWTGDHRLYNALHIQYTFVRWIADYQRQRPAEEEEAPGLLEA